MENTNMNIPTTTVTGIIEMMAQVYTEAINSNVKFIELPTPFLWGAPSVGKSEGIYQLADNLSLKTSKKTVVTDVRLLLFSPVDLRGVPVADKNREFTNWLCPRIFQMDSSADTINILFLDELSAAPQSVQAAAYQICLDRCVGEHKLPENCIVIAAGNRTTDRSVSYKMPKALCNRLMHFLVEPSYIEWKRWALDHQVDQRIIGYLGFDGSKLCMEPENSDLAYPTPRSWHFVSRLIRNYPDNLSDAHPLISSCIGVDTALSFEEWCKVYRNLPKIEDILAGVCIIYPKSHDVLYALCSSLTTTLYRMKDSITDAQLNNVCTYVLRFPPDFVVALFGDLNREEALKLKLMNNRLFNAWLYKNRHSV